MATTCNIHIHTVQCRYNAVSFLLNPTNPDVCTAAVTRVLYAISCCIGPHYNGIGRHIYQCLWQMSLAFYFHNTFILPLTHWDRATHICVSNLTIIASDNGLSPGRRQAIIWTSAGMLLIGPLGTNFSEILVEIVAFSFKKTRLKVSSAKWRPCCLGLNVLTNDWLTFICTLWLRVVVTKQLTSLQIPQRVIPINQP